MLYAKCVFCNMAESEDVQDKPGSTPPTPKPLPRTKFIDKNENQSTVETKSKGAISKIRKFIPSSIPKYKSNEKSDIKHNERQRLHSVPPRPLPSKKPYKRGISHDNAPREVLRNNSGNQRKPVSTKNKPVIPERPLTSKFPAYQNDKGNPVLPEGYIPPTAQHQAESNPPTAQQPAESNPPAAQQRAESNHQNVTNTINREEPMEANIIDFQNSPVKNVPDFVKKGKIDSKHKFVEVSQQAIACVYVAKKLFSNCKYKEVC